MTHGVVRGYPRELLIEEGDEGQPVERFLRRRLRADPPHVQKLLRQRRVLRLGDDGDDVELCRGDTLPASGRVLVRARGERPPPQPNRRIRSVVLLEDDDLAVIDKPSGLATHPGPRHGTDTVLNALIARYPELLELGRERGYGLVHRLDRETSGLLVIARTAPAYDGLVEAFKQRRVDKRYAALVDVRSGRVESITLDAPVGGKPARTDVELEERIGPVARLSLRPHTGRMHQIRVHLRDAGWPVLRDDRYGSGADDLTARLYLKRLALHAERIHFLHPRTGEPVAVERPMPRDLRHAWKRADRVWGAGAGSGDRG